MRNDTFDSPATTRRAFAAAAVMALVFTALIVWTHQCRDRSFIGAHGFLHSALVYSVLDHGVPPENPFAAGEAMPYYWGYHAAAAGVAGALDVNPLRAFEILNIASLLAFVLAMTAVGRALLGSTGRGVLAALLALAAAHPFGPVMLGIDVLNGAVDFSPHVAPDRHLHPYRMALYAGDVRFCTILAWFLNPSGRGLGLGLAAVALWLGVRAGAAPRGARALGWWGGLVLAVAALTAIAPLLAGALIGAGFGVGVLRPSRRGTSVRLVLAGIAGVALAAPTWVSMLGTVGEGPPLFNRGALPGAVARVALTGGPMALLALIGGWRMMRARGAADTGERGPATNGPATNGPVKNGSVKNGSVKNGPGESDNTWLLLGGLLMFAFAVLVRLPVRNEHNVFHLGMVFLSLPAAVALGRLRRAPSWLVVVIMAAVFLPAPLLHYGSAWLRTPSGCSFPPDCIVGAGGPARRAVHTWLRTETPADTVIIDTAAPADGEPHFWCNVSALPAEARRALWIDRPSYLIPRTGATKLRARVLARLIEGSPLTADERRGLEEVAGRVRILCRGPAGRSNAERALGRPTRVEYEDDTYLVLAIEPAAPDPG